MSQMPLGEATFGVCDGRNARDKFGSSSGTMMIPKQLPAAWVTGRLRGTLCGVCLAKGFFKALFE